MPTELQQTAAEEKGVPLQERDKAEVQLAEIDLKVIPNLHKQWQKASSQKGWSLDFGNIELSHLDKTHPRNPFYVVSVDSEIIDGHGGIWKPEFANFLRRFILFSLMASDKP